MMEGSDAPLSSFGSGALASPGTAQPRNGSGHSGPADGAAFDRIMANRGGRAMVTPPREPGRNFAASPAGRQPALERLQAEDTSQADVLPGEGGSNTQGSHDGASQLSAAVQGVVGRLDVVEGERLPRLEARLDDLATARPSQELQEVLAALRAALEGASVRRRQMLSDSNGDRGSRSLPAPLPSTASGWGRALALGAARAVAAIASAADAAAVSLANSMLIGDSPATSTDATSASPTANMARAALGVALMIAAVEAAAAARRQMQRSASRRLGNAARPLRVGLATARTAVWAGAMLLLAGRARAACLAAADLTVRCVTDNANSTPRMPGWMPAWMLRSPSPRNDSNVSTGFTISNGDSSSSGIGDQTHPAAISDTHQTHPDGKAATGRHQARGAKVAAHDEQPLPPGANTPAGTREVARSHVEEGDPLFGSSDEK